MKKTNFESPLALLSKNIFELFNFIIITLVVYSPILQAEENYGQNGLVNSNVEAEIGASIDQVFDYTVAENVLPKVLHGYGPFPAVVGTKILIGPWEQVGALRFVGIITKTIFHTYMKNVMRELKVQIESLQDCEDCKKLRI